MNPANSHPDDLLPAVLQVLKSVAPNPRMVIGPATRIMSELDLDSLRMLELVAILKDKFETDFLDPAHSIEELLTAETIVVAIRKERLARPKKGHV